MELRKSLFWDSKMTQEDYDKHWKEVILRVVERGNFDEWNKIKEYFGLEKIKEAVITASYLDNYCLSFFSNYFNIPENEFACYIMKQYNKELWPY